MKKLFLLSIAGALLLPPVADARDWRAGRSAMVQAQGQPIKKGPGPYQRGENNKQRGEHDKRNQNRLTQEERRELNRDLDRANREIYRRR